MANYLSSSINLGIAREFIYNPTPIKKAFLKTLLLADIYHVNSASCVHMQPGKLINRISKCSCGIENLYIFLNAYVQGIYTKSHHSELKIVTYS